MTAAVDRAAVLAARRASALARVEGRVTAAVEAAPPLPDDVADRLRRIIRAATARDERPVGTEVPT